MRRLSFGLVAALAVTLAIGARMQAAPSHPTLNWGTMVNAGACDTSGPPVINVTGKIVNDVDSGQAGNYWAFDNFNRSIQVWAQGDGTYCAVVRFTGKFDAQAGQTSPGNTGPLSGNEDGTFEGGYVGTINGVLRANPAWKTRGNVGTIDYDCDLSGNCPGYVSWINQYFTGATFDYDWWGWVYHGTRNSWINAITGNAGDVF